jgi:predicted RNA-binding protein with PIN domain
MPFLIDGHNLIGQTPGLALSDPDDERKLVALLQAYLARARKKGTVVFDQGLPGGRSHWSNNVLQVYFASPPQTADGVILERLRREKNPGGLTVVSGDQRVADAARRRGAAVMAPSDFAQKMLSRPAAPHKKQTGLAPDEVEFWEKEFNRRGNASKTGNTRD